MSLSKNDLSPTGPENIWQRALFPLSCTDPGIPSIHSPLPTTDPIFPYIQAHRTWCTCGRSLSFFLLFRMFAHLFYRYKSCDLSLCLQLRFYLYLTARQISPKATISINACPRRGWFYSLFPVFPVLTQGSPIFTVSDQLSDTFYICCSQMVTRQNL